VLERQLARPAEIKGRRRQEDVTAALDALRRAAEDTDNLMPTILDAVRAYASVGKLFGVLGGVFGGYRAPPGL
jgi:methylmalonyl-CoA mutase, N-terminal domain